LKRSLEGDCIEVLAFLKKGLKHAWLYLEMLWNTPSWCGVVIQSKGDDALGSVFSGQPRTVHTLAVDCPVANRRTVHRPIPENIIDYVQSVGDNSLNNEQSAPDGQIVHWLTSAGNKVVVISAQFHSLNGGQSAPEWQTVHRSFSSESRSADGSG
jgi:hypothetical protein